MWFTSFREKPHSRTWLPLTILYYARKIYGRVRFQKMVFLCKTEEKISTEYEFESYKYGPFSFDLASDLSDLSINYELIDVEEIPFVTSDGISTTSVYSLTNKGKKYVEKEVLTRLDEEQKKAIQLIINKYASLSLDKLLSYVYEKYI